jgi:hypothetical protein
MDDSVNLPVSLPRPNPNASLWQYHPAPDLADRRGGAIDETDVLSTLIIGSGVTGTSIAWHLTRAPARERGRVVMLEARQACSGATGRNGNHSIP